MFIAVLLASVLSALPAVSQTESSSATTNPPPNREDATKLETFRDQGARSLLGLDSTDEKIQSSIAFTESLRIIANDDGTWLIDPRLLVSGFLARTSNGKSIMLYIEVTTNEDGEEGVALKWRPSDDMVGSIVISDGELSVVKSTNAGYSECLKSMRLNNFTSFLIDELVLRVQVDRQGQPHNSFTVATSGIAERDYFSLEIPGVVTMADCTDLVYSTEVRRCTFRNGMSCKDAVIVDN